MAAAAAAIPPPPTPLLASEQLGDLLTAVAAVEGVDCQHDDKQDLLKVVCVETGDDKDYREAEDHDDAGPNESFGQTESPTEDHGENDHDRKRNAAR